MTAEGGIRFGQYVLLKRIARGGMAEVFLAQQRGLEGFDRRVAVKRILPHLSDSQDFVKMFLGEAKLAAQLTHPNVVHIYDFGKVESDYFIAMEFVDGVHAGEIFKRGELEPDRLSPTLIARIGADAASALHYAHELQAPNGTPYGLVHRDVSPANIMVSFDGAVKLCDFGIAKAAAMSDQLTNPGQVKGKYAYMSPEQTVAAPLDGRSDVFSLGIVLWELLAGRTIVGRGDAVDAMRAIRDGKLERIEKVVPRTPLALAKAINWALETKRERRATAADLAGALEAFIKSSPEIATPMQLAQWVRGRFTREMTGPQSRHGTGTAPAPSGGGTVVSTGTNLSVVTPSSLIAASRISNPFVDDDYSETVAIGPPPMASPRASAPADDDLSQRAAEESTVPRPFRRRDPENEATFRPGAATVVVDPDEPDVNETMVRSGAFKQLVSAAGASVPTRETPALPPPPRAHSGQVVDTASVRRSGPRPAILFAVLGAITVASFLIALAAKSCGSGAPAAKPPADAIVLPVIITPVDAGEADAAATPTIPLDAPATAQMAFLEITTHPEGATVRIGDQSRTAPARFAIPVGTYHIIAELDGWEPEERDVVVEREHFVEEIAFMRKKRGTAPRGSDAPKHETGKLSARTTPWSEVFLGNRKLGETPFADLELPVGTYQITFKAASHTPVTKKVPIVAGKNTKVQFVFP